MAIEAGGDDDEGEGDDDDDDVATAPIVEEGYKMMMRMMIVLMVLTLPLLQDAFLTWKGIHSLAYILLMNIDDDQARRPPLPYIHVHRFS